MGKTIWIVNEYAGSPYHGMVYRHYYLAKEWIKNGYKVAIISASYSHNFRKFPKMEKNIQKENIDGIDYYWVKVLKYKNAHDPKRVFKWFEFSLKLFNVDKYIYNKPDVIICSPTPPTFPIYASYKFAKRYNAKLIYEVRDIWPLTMMEMKSLSIYHPLVFLLEQANKFALKKSDEIVSVLPNYGDYLKDVNAKRGFTWISNGISWNVINRVEPLDESVKNILPKNGFIIGYTGTIGEANALEYFCEAAKILRNNKDIYFVIVGEGKNKKLLQEKYNISNLLFINAIPKTQVQSMLKLFDACYIGLKKKDLFKYGVSPNKLFDYMYSGKPILYAINSGKNNIVKLANCGICVEAENPEAIKNGILKLYSMNENERKILGENGRRYVLENFTYDKLAKKYEKLF